MTNTKQYKAATQFVRCTRNKHRKNKKTKNKKTRKGQQFPSTNQQGTNQGMTRHFCTLATLKLGHRQNCSGGTSPLLFDNQMALLVAVGKVVVACAHVVVDAPGELENATTEGSRCIVKKNIELCAILCSGNKGVRISLVVVRMVKPSSCHTQGPVALDRGPWLTRVFAQGHDKVLLVICINGIKHVGKHGVFLPSSRVAFPKLATLELNKVMAICTTTTLPSISCLTITGWVTVVMGVGASPLDMDEVALCNVKVIRHKVILDRRKGLHNVATLAPYVKVINGAGTKEVCRLGCSTWTGADFGCGRAWDKAEHVATVLERTSELGSVDGKAQGSVLCTNVNVWVLADWRNNASTPVVVEA
eukprot:m.156097 g.156097  ORF g.156097 m.156097 type:complete len:361 (+) comp14313_c0_seq1:1209-2291(+)